MSEEDPVHMFRIFEATPTFDNEEKTFLTVRGYCAWSVYSCMMEGFGTYYNDCYKGTNATTIDRLAKDLNLYIEIISEEPLDGNKIKEVIAKTGYTLNDIASSAYE